jgi:hypothetical protein
MLKVVMILLSIPLAYYLGILLIGKPMARKGLDIWMNHYMKGGSGGTLGFLLFPQTSFEGRIGVEPTICMNTANSALGMRDPQFKQAYINLSATFWLPRLIVNFVGMIVVGIQMIMIFVFFVLVELMPKLCR